MIRKPWRNPPGSRHRGVAAAVTAAKEGFSTLLLEKTNILGGLVNLFVPIGKLQDKLEVDNIMVHFPDEYMPEDRTIVIHGKNHAQIEGGHL